MASPVHCSASFSESAGKGSFREPFCLPFLRQAQNADGGWGYHPAGRSAVEPTCWAALALAGRSDSEQARARATDWLLAAQLPDGSWPAFAGQKEGCWVAPLACLALHERKDAQDAVARGLEWLCNAWPAEGSLWQRLRLRLFVSSSVLRQDYSLRGWSWTPRTSSWVEPTAYALILLRRLFPDAPPRHVAKRQQLGEAMLYDRMCSGGGWNSGNPSVYGVAGEPLVGPTVWALLALEHGRERTENRKSLDWLAGACEQAQGPGSLALAHLCLETYGRPTPPLEPRLLRFYEANRFLQNVCVAAFAAMALDPANGWWRCAGREP